jgi:hypothetical protein
VHVPHDVGATLAASTGLHLVPAAGAVLQVRSDGVLACGVAFLVFRRLASRAFLAATIVICGRGGRINAGDMFATIENADSGLHGAFTIAWLNARTSLDLLAGAPAEIAARARLDADRTEI